MTRNIGTRFNGRLAGLRIATGIALGALVFTSAQAQEITPEHLHAAKAALAASESTSSMDGILPSIGEKAKEQLITNRPDAAEQISQIVDESTIALASRRGDLEEEVARIYARVFTQDELKVIEDFYKTEAGRKLIRETPVIARSMDQAARVWSTGLQRDLGQEVGKRLKEAGLE
ncbi:MAG: DUF2059 domain-containing protein [Rhizobiaceae bacterium]